MLNQPRPATRFPKFLQANLQLMDEIVARLGGFRLAVIGIRRCARAQNLSRNVISCTRVRKFFRQINHCRSKFQQSFFQVVLSPARRIFMERPPTIVRIVRCSMFDVRCWMFPLFHFIPFPHSTAARVGSPRRDDRAHVQQPCPRHPELFSGSRKNPGSPAESPRPPATAVPYF